MQDSLAGALRVRRSDVRRQWEEMLRVEPVGTPLGNPDALAHLIDWTLDEIYGALAHPLVHQRVHARHSHSTPAASCQCGGNPLLRYFSAGSQAMREALILSQAQQPDLDPMERDASLTELNLVLAEISRREIEAFCSVCYLRNND
ncbi:MAG: hypothetical protein ABIQ12_00400 [Opitutaceae bacterium]